MPAACLVGRLVGRAWTLGGVTNLGERERDGIGYDSLCLATLGTVSETAQAPLREWGSRATALRDEGTSVFCVLDALGIYHRLRSRDLVWMMSRHARC